MSNTMTISGRVVRDPQLRFSQSGTAVATFSVADNKRRLNKQTGEWENDGDTLFLDVVAWKQLAEAGAEQLRQGDLVMVTGEVRQRNWETKEGQKRVSFELIASDVAVSVKSKKPVGASAGSQSAELPW